MEIAPDGVEHGRGVANDDFDIMKKSDEIYPCADEALCASRRHP